MKRRALLGLVIAFSCAALFVRLGVWQLARLDQKQAFNAVLSQRLSAPPVDISTLPADTALGHYRRVSAGGLLLYGHEVVYAGRSHNGSPGVDILTPMKLANHDTVVLVNRGWIYSPDAATADLSKWHELDSLSVSGFAETFAGKERGTAKGRIHALDRDAAQAIVGMPVAPYVLVQTSDTAHRDSVPVRLELPTLDEGPHRSYAIQWFSFAVVAVVGGVIMYRRSA